MTDTARIFGLENNDPATLAAWVAEALDPHAALQPGDDAAAIAADMLDALGGAWFAAEIEAHGRDAVEAALETALAAHIARL